MTTRLQRKRLVGLEHADEVFSTEACRIIWAAVCPSAMPSDFPVAVRLYGTAYLEMAHDPSAGEMRAATSGLYRELMKAIADDDAKAAASAAEKKFPSRYAPSWSG